MAEIKDYGEKIGGAKKDLWKIRGLMINDLSGMNDREKVKYVKKDNIWKKPDYNELVKNGLPVRIAYFYKIVRDSLPAKPVFSYLDKTDEEKNKRISDYVDFIGKFRDAVMNCHTEKACERIFSDFLFGQGYIKKEGYCLSVSENVSGVLNNKVLNALRKSWVFIDNQIKKKQFCYSDTDKLLAPFSFYLFEKDNIKFSKDYNNKTVMEYPIPGGKRFFYPTGGFEHEENWNDHTIFVTQRHTIIANNFPNLDMAKQYALSVVEPQKEEILNKKTSKKERKKKFVPKQLIGIERTGPEYVKRNITGQDYLDLFAIRGGEFGNWMSDKDRQASLDYGYEAFCDLADILQISYTDISFKNRLSIAFGARGSGNASAHYEMERKVINLTKLSGAGCLAHEWGHALDDYLGECFGINGFLSENIHSIKAKNVPQELKELFNCIRYKQFDEKTDSDYFKGSLEFDRNFTKHGYGYWHSSVEMFARAFDCYITDKLKENNRVSDYLTCHANSYVTEDYETGKPVYAIPVGEERKAINACFDKMFAMLKERKLLQAQTMYEEPVRSDINIVREQKKEYVIPDIDYENCKQLSFADLFDMPEPVMQSRKRSI